MTREHKLALIIGFSLVLVVGVLISDHFSKARSQPLASEITPGTAERFGADTRGMRVVAVSAPGPTILTPPQGAGGAMPPGLLPPASDPVASAGMSLPAGGGGTELVMGVAPQAAGAGSESLIERAIGPGNGTALANTGQSTLPPLPAGEFTPSGVQPIDPATGGPLNRVPQPGTPSPVSLGGPHDVSAPFPPAPPKVEPKEEMINGVPRGMMTRHDVREGESAYRIAQEVYGDGKLWTKLIEYNKGKMAANGSLREGVTLLLPPKEALLGKPLPAAGTTPAPTPSKPAPAKTDARTETRTASKPDKADKPAAKTYTIQKGDSLSDIARKTLGSSKRWNEIVELNKDVLEDEDTLVVGRTLKLPSR